MKGALIGVLSALLATAADAQPAHGIRGDCDVEDPHAWAPLARPPAAAEPLRAQADAAPNFSVPQHWVAETWFALAGETLLCRSDAALPKACAGEWWRFDAVGKLAAHDSWLCLAR